MIYPKQVDLSQGEYDDGSEFGFVAGDDGGFFFDHLSTLDETVASVEACEVDGDGGLDDAEVREFLRRYLPTVMDIYEAEAEDEDLVDCQICHGRGEPLGRLGSTMHYRCRSCGILMMKEL